MISVGKSYKVLNVKDGTTKKGDHWVSLGIGNNEFNAETKEWINKGFVNIFSTTPCFFAKGDKIKVSEITGADTKEYNGKTYVTIFAKIESEAQTIENANYEVSQDELPF